MDRRIQLGAIAATDSFTHALPQMRIHLAEAKENVGFYRMLLSQEDRTRQNILGMKDSLVLDRQGGLGAYGLDASDPMSIGEAISKSVNSGKEIGVSIWDGIETRNEKKFDSAYDFSNYVTVGLPDGVVNMYHASDARYQAMKNDVSIRTVLNYMTIGTTGMIKVGFNPEDPFSAEHWMNSFGTVSLFTGGMLAWKKGGGTSPKINYTDKKIKVDKGNVNLKNIDEFIDGTKTFDDVVDDLARLYSEKIQTNKNWSWNKSFHGGEYLTARQRKFIKEKAIEDGLIPNVNVIKADGMRYGFADFKSAGLVVETKDLPESLWFKSDESQFEWLDNIIGGRPEGMTWHHTEVPGKMLSHSKIFTFYYSLSLCIRIDTIFSTTSFVIVFSLWVLQYHKFS